MKKEQFLFLIGGFAFGVLVGFGIFKVHSERPRLDLAAQSGQIGSPAGPRAPGQGQTAGGGGAAPMTAQINELKRRLEANPEDFAAAVMLGGMYYQVGMFPQALEFYDIAVSIRPDDPDLLTDSGNVRREMGRHADALERFRQAHEIDPNHWQALFNTVVVATFDLNQMELADTAFAKLETLNAPPAQLAELKEAMETFRAQQAGNPSAP